MTDRQWCNRVLRCIDSEEEIEERGYDLRPLYYGGVELWDGVPADEVISTLEEMVRVEIGLVLE